MRREPFRSYGAAKTTLAVFYKHLAPNGAKTPAFRLRRSLCHSLPPYGKPQAYRTVLRQRRLVEAQLEPAARFRRIMLATTFKENTDGNS